MVPQKYMDLWPQSTRSELPEQIFFVAHRDQLECFASVSVSAVVSALQLVPMSSKKKFGQLTLTRETVATDPCTLEGPSPGGDGGDTVGT